MNTKLNMLTVIKIICTLAQMHLYSFVLSFLIKFALVNRYSWDKLKPKTLINALLGKISIYFALNDHFREIYSVSTIHRQFHLLDCFSDTVLSRGMFNCGKTFTYCTRKRVSTIENYFVFQGTRPWALYSFQTLRSTILRLYCRQYAIIVQYVRHVDVIWIVICLSKYFKIR